MTDKKLISSLQGLRAVAFLCVVISHCGAPWLGPWAISVFVALSGFLMVCNYYDRPRTALGLQSAIAFSFKKIRRLYPLHLIMMAAALLFVLKGLLAQPSARGVLSCAAQLAVSIFLLQTWIPSSRFWFCLNGVAWYYLTIICSEIFQYFRIGADHLALIHSCPSGFKYTVPPNLWISL